MLDGHGAVLGVDANTRVRVSFEIERDTIGVGSSYRALGGVIDAAVGGVMSTENSLLGRGFRDSSAMKRAALRLEVEGAEWRAMEKRVAAAGPEVVGGEARPVQRKHGRSGHVGGSRRE